MTRRLNWPVELERQEDGSLLVSFPDLPEALTEGATHAEALTQTRDCLVAALGSYVGARRAIPRHAGKSRFHCRRSSPPRSRTMAQCGPRVSATPALAARLGLTEGAVRRLTDLDHRPHVGQVEMALRALGQRLTVA